jgi:hypothetical protein
MEAKIGTGPEVNSVLGELISLERRLHWPPSGTSRAELDSLIVEDFRETGASGRIYSRESVMEELERRTAAEHPQEAEISDPYCRRLGPDAYLLTYSLVQNRVRRTRRSTIWERTAEGWKAVYHQGTFMESSGEPENRE